MVTDLAVCNILIYQIHPAGRFTKLVLDALLELL